ncbi:hypothetical protein ACIQMJ_21025 [Actinosynnema sp. NPDC091369]
MGRSQARAVVVSLALVGALLGSLFSAGSASAQGRSAGTQSGGTGSGQVRASATQPADIDRVTAVPSTGKVSCYGYTGTFLAGTNVVVVNWLSTDDECFGIATDRTIWHAWPGSGGWHKMPGGGYADSVAYSLFLENPSTEQREVVFWTRSSDKFWCQDFRLPGGWDAFWFECH